MSLTDQDMRDMVEGYKKRDKVVFRTMPKQDEEDKIIEDWMESPDIGALSIKYKKKSNEIQEILERNGLI
jgi:hypothetical protein